MRNYPSKKSFCFYFCQSLWLLASLYTLPLYAGDQCSADLARLNKNFCLSNVHVQPAEGDPEKWLDYHWDVTSDPYELKFASCLVGENQESSSDLILVLDRSHTMKIANLGEGEFKDRNVALVKKYLESLRTENTFKSITVANLGGNSTCESFKTDDAFDESQVKCRFVKIEDLNDEIQSSLLENYLENIENTYMTQNLRSGSILDSVKDLVQKNSLTGQMVLFSDMAFYEGDDDYAYLKPASYQKSSDRLQKLFSEQTLANLRTDLFLFGTKSLRYNSTSQNAMENMCGLEPALEACGENVDFTKPNSWLVNQLDLSATAQQLGRTISGDSTVVTAADSVANAQLLTILSDLKSSFPLKIESAQIVADGESNIIGQIEKGNKIVFPNLKLFGERQVEIHLSASDQLYVIPFNLSVRRSSSNQTDNASEMLCLNSQSSTLGDQAKLSGAPLCGALLGAHKEKNSVEVLWGLMLVLLPLGILFFRNRFVLLTLLSLLLVMGANQSLIAEEQKQGFEISGYDPVLGGVASVDHGFTRGAGVIAGGLFYDYASKLIVASQAGKKIDLLANRSKIHAVLSANPAKRLELGLAMPFLLRQDWRSPGALADAKKSGLADGTFWAKIWLLQINKTYVGIKPLVGLAVGSRENMTGDELQKYGGYGLVSTAIGRHAMAMNLGYMYRPEELNLQLNSGQARASLGSQYLLKIGYSYLFSRMFTPGISYRGRHAVQQRTTAANYDSLLLQLTSRIGQTIHFDTGVSFGLNNAVGNENYRIVSGFSYVPLIKSIKKRRRSQ